MLLGSMADESFSIIVVVPPRRPTFLNGTDPCQNLIVLNVNAQAPLKLIAMNYFAWQFFSHPESRSDPIGGSESSSGREIIYWDSLPALSDVGISKSYNYINITYTKVQNKTTIVVVFTVSHIQY